MGKRKMRGRHVRGQTCSLGFGLVNSRRASVRVCIANLTSNGQDSLNDSLSDSPNDSLTGQDRLYDRAHARNHAHGPQRSQDPKQAQRDEELEVLVHRRTPDLTPRRRGVGVCVAEDDRETRRDDLMMPYR